MAGLKFSDDEVIRRKLMFDGEGVGDDRRLNQLIKAFCTWSNQVKTDKIKQEEKGLQYERMMIMLGDAELSMKKSESIKRMCSAELKEYENIFSTIEGDIESSKSQLTHLKEQLVEAKAERKNKSEANALVKLIEEFPSREETNKKLVQANDEIENLEKSTIDLRARLEQWRKQFEVLVGAATDLNTLLEEDHDGDSQDKNSQVDEPMEVTVAQEDPGKLDTKA